VGESLSLSLSLFFNGRKRGAMLDKTAQMEQQTSRGAATKSKQATHGSGRSGDAH
jgi:hypothetical protein